MLQRLGNKERQVRTTYPKKKKKTKEIDIDKKERLARVFGRALVRVGMKETGSVMQ